MSNPCNICLQCRNTTDFNFVFKITKKLPFCLRIRIRCQITLCPKSCCYPFFICIFCKVCKILYVCRYCRQSFLRAFSFIINAACLAISVLSLTLMVYSYYYSKKHDIPVTGRFDIVKCARSFLRAIWGMLSVLFVVVGVIAGVFTTTESAACAVVWSLIVGLFIYKGFGLKDIPGIFHNVTMTLGKVLILLGVSGAFTYLLTYLKVPEQVSGVLFSITDNKILILIMLNVLMLLLGCLIEMACLILMLTPVILPIWMSLGLSPIHLGVVMVLNLGIGLLTPPVGSTLFIGSAISGIKIEKLSKHMIPFYLVMGIALLILTYFPQSFMWLPNMAY